MFKKPFAGFILFALLLPSLLIPASILITPRETRAAVPILCQLGLDYNCNKESIIDVAVKAAVNAMLRTLTTSTVNWIQGGGGNFVMDLQQELGRQLDLRMGEYLNQLSGINLCGNLGAYLQINLRSYGGRLSQVMGCTLTGIVANVQGFFTNFQNGGWQAFARVTLVPENNPYGAFMIAEHERIIREASITESVKNTYLSGSGFLGTQKCYQVSTGDIGADGDTIMTTKCDATTPGDTVAGMLKDAIGTDNENLIAADEVAELVNAVFGALVQRAMTSIF